ncbi:Hypothetical predicted protein [Lecanosticta acicola]|uniref:UBC core domain-containing protein n=1 Tax=Lecanosticta acicola TaxID=111012 RepID=A0AAI8YTT1_9PEZI|nr:Hypothetical predicted protein [Lecanosticta acicola]
MPPPTTKRILKEASELASQPSPDYHAAPLETDLYEWHFTLRGPPAPSPFAGGIYHGRIVLPPAYPLKPPSFRFLTPTGRFEVNREICLSISGHHEETWQPAWGIRTALVAIRSFMDTDAKGQLGGMDSSEEVRKRLAAQSRAGRCAACGGRANEEIMREQEEHVKAVGGGAEGAAKKDEVPEELRLAYRDDLDGKAREQNKAESSSTKQENATAVPTGPPASDPVAREPTQQPVPTPTRPVSGPAPVTPAVVAAADQRQQEQQQRAALRLEDNGVPAWIDKAIYGILAALAFLLVRKML